MRFMERIKSLEVSDKTSRAKYLQDLNFLWSRYFKRGAI